MISFSAAHSGNNPSPFGAQTKSKAPASPPENVTMTINKNQICCLQVPHGTPRAAAIRQWLSTYCLNPTTNVRLWIFRRNINWTTIALDSTDDQPKLTATPAEAAIVTRREMNRCPEVGEFKVLDWNNNIIADDISIDHLDFDPIVPINPPRDSFESAPEVSTANGAKPLENSIAEMRTHVDGLGVNFTRDLVQLEAKIMEKTAGTLDDKLAAMERRQQKLADDKFAKLSKIIVDCTYNSQKSVDVTVHEDGMAATSTSVASAVQSPAACSNDVVTPSLAEVGSAPRTPKSPALQIRRPCATTPTRSASESAGLPAASGRAEPRTGSCCTKSSTHMGATASSASSTKSHRAPLDRPYRISSRSALNH